MKVLKVICLIFIYFVGLQISSVIQHSAPLPYSQLGDTSPSTVIHADPDGHNDDHDYSSIVLPEIDYEREIISITTDSTYRSTSDYAEAATLNQTYKNGSFDKIQSFPDERINLQTKSPYFSVQPLKNRPSISTTSSDLFGSLFGFLFKDDVPIEESFEDPLKPTNDVTIPPFRNISSTLSLTDILNNITGHATKPAHNHFDLPQRINNKIFETPTTEPMQPISSSSTTTHVENLNILRDVLLETINNPSEPNHISGIYHHNPSVHKFLSPIFPPVVPQDVQPKHTFDYNPIRSELDLILPTEVHSAELNSNEFSADVGGVPEYSGLSNTNAHVGFDSYTLNRHQSDGPAQIFTKPSNGGRKESVGLLKLAGCNIYGRMYRVGRIIDELSSACLECKCTEVGVHCTPLNC